MFDDVWSVTNERHIREIRQEARLVQEEVEATVAELAASERSLRDALIDYGKRGYEVRVEAGDRAVVGRIGHVGSTLIRLATSQGRIVDIAIAMIVGVRRLPGAPRPGVVTTGHPGSMIARLREAVQTHELVHLERSGGEELDGRVVAVSKDALELESTIGTWLVPVEAILWLWRP